MTRVRAVCGRDWYLLTAKGHAGYAPGHDIVCASVSAIVYALAGAFTNLPCRALRHREEPGDAMVFCRCTDRAAYGAFLTAQVGLAQIAAAYPQNVTVT